MISQSKLSLKSSTRLIGLLSTLFLALDLLLNPTFLTPDKLFFILIFVFMMFGQSWQYIKHLGPFIGLLLIYESFRSIVPNLNSHVNFGFMPAADRFLFGTLPTSWLQHHWWNGHVQWYDFVLYLFYMLHFVLPITLALVIWKTREKGYWRYVVSYLSVSFGAFIVFLAFPAAPPWMASEHGVIEPIARISSHVWRYLGIKDFPSLYNHLAANPVAAMPSLHAAYATLFFLFVRKLYGNKRAALASIYPLSIYLGTVYQGEHYAIDEIAGILFAVGAYFASPYVLKWLTSFTEFSSKKIRIAYVRLAN